MQSPSTICVYCSSSDAVAPEFFAVAREVGAFLARRNATLIYGGGCVGLMGAVAKSVHQHGGRVVGIIPSFMRRKEIAYEAADELIVTKDLRERKALMEARAEAFLALPGGFGTLEETLEILTLKQLETHQKPVVFLNTNGFFDALLALFEQMFEQKFAKPGHRQHYHVAARPAEIFAHLDHYTPPPRVRKWFDTPH